MRLVLIADTHTKEELVELPDGDVLIHAGDFDLRHHIDVTRVDEWFSRQPHKHKLWIAGNHDFYPERFDPDIFRTLTNFSTYLQDSSVTIEGIKFYGIPWTPIFNDWAFMAGHERMIERVSLIPEDVDVLISHGPCYGILDQLRKANGDLGMNCGCVPLRDAVKKRVKPSVFVCGHIHEAYGKYYDYQTNFFNVSFMDEYYHPVNSPMVVDIFKMKDGSIEVVG